MSLLSRRSWLLLVLLLLPALAAAAQAQRPALRGQIVDPEGRAVAGVAVSLHHVSDGGGAEVGRAVSDLEGWFEIEFAGAGDAGDGVYFAATRFDGTLFMGEPFRSFAELPAAYQIVIGVGGIGGGPALSAPEGSVPSRGWGVFLLCAALGIVVVLLPFRRARRGPLAVRTLLADLAALDEGHAALSLETRTAGAAEYLSVREGLRARVWALAGTRTDAADQH